MSRRRPLAIPACLVVGALLLCAVTSASASTALPASRAHAATAQHRAGGLGTQSVTAPLSVVVYRLAPSPIAPSGRLAAKATVDVTFSADDGLGQGIPGASVYLSFAPTNGGGSARVGGTALTGAPARFTTGSRGTLQVTYIAPATLPATGVDTLIAQDLAQSPTQVTTDSYAFTRGYPVVSVGDATVVEGDQHPAIPPVFTVSLSAPQPNPVTVQYTTPCGVGDEPCNVDDFQQITKPVTVTIPAHSASTTITVAQYAYVGASGRETYNEGWFVKLTRPAGAVLGRSVGTGLLLPDVESGHSVVADLYVGDVGVVPSSASSGVPMNVTVTLGGVQPGPVTFHYATSDGSAVAGRDYTATSGTGVIPSGRTSTIISVEELPGAPPQSDRTFTVMISAVSGDLSIGRATGVQTILAN